MHAFCTGIFASGLLLMQWCEEFSASPVFLSRLAGGGRQNPRLAMLEFAPPRFLLVITHAFSRKTFTV